MATRKLSTPAPTTYAELERLLREHLNDFSKSNRRIAELILADPAGFAFKTIGDAARAVDVNQSTVNRFATGIGLDGYPALTGLCKQRLRDQALMVDRFEHLRARADGTGSALRETATLDQENITRTFSNINARTFKTAAGRIAKARQVHVMGLRKCYGPAALLTYLLHLVRDDVYQVDLQGGLLTDHLRALGPRDVFIAMSISRYTQATVQSLAFARSRKTTTISITDNPASPLAERSDLAFFVDTASNSILRSVTAFTSLIQALATEVATQSGTQTRAALRQQENLLEDFKIFESGD